MLFIFDWDGTLIDSTGKIVHCMQRAIDHVGLAPRTDTQVKEIIGLGLPEAILQLFPQISDGASQSLRGAYAEFFIAADKTPCDFYPGVMAVLQHLRDEGHQLSVATGKSRKGLDRVLGNLNMASFFDATRCADETASKPHPLMLEQLLEELGHSSAAAVMVGDTAFDLEMANNAGIDSIAVSYGAHGVERLLPHRPQRCIDHFQELLDWLESR